MFESWCHLFFYRQKKRHLLNLFTNVTWNPTLMIAFFELHSTINFKVPKTFRIGQNLNQLPNNFRKFVWLQSTTKVKLQCPLVNRKKISECGDKTAWLDNAHLLQYIRRFKPTTFKWRTIIRDFSLHIFLS